MAKAIIPLVTDKTQRDPYVRGTGEEGTDAVIRNGYVEKHGQRIYVTKRPAFNALASLTTGYTPKFSATFKGVSGFGGVTENYPVAAFAYSGGASAGKLVLVDPSMTVTTKTLTASAHTITTPYGLDFGDIPPTGATPALYVLGVNSGGGTYPIQYVNGPGSSMAEVTANAGGGALTFIDGGLVYMDGYLFALAAPSGSQYDIAIYNSGLGTPQTWSAGDFISAERSPDTSRYLVKSYDHIIVWGDSSIEFFYNAGNPTGSPLSRRQDIFYNYGTVTRPWKNNVSDTIYFIGSEFDSKRFLAKLDKFQVVKVENAALDKLLNSATISGSSSHSLSGFTFNNRTFLTISYPTQGNTAESNTLIYDVEANMVYTWDMAAFGTNPEIALCAYVTDASTGRHKTLVSLNSSTSPELLWLDTQTYRDSNAIGGTSAITFQVTTDKWRGNPGEEGNKKFISEATLVCDRGAVGETVAINWSDDDYQTFNTGLSIPLDLGRKHCHRLGKTYERAFRLTYTGNYPLRLEHLELEYDLGVS